MNILVLTNMYPPQHLGGYELACRDTVQRWREHGHAVTVLTSDLRLRDVPGSDDAEPKVLRELRIYWRDHEIVNPSVRVRLSIERHNQRVLRTVLDKINPDVVSVWNMGAMSLGVLTSIAKRGLPIVFVVFDDWLLYAANLDAWLRLCRRAPVAGRLIARALGMSSGVELHDDVAYCFISDWIARRAIEGATWPVHRPTIVYCGIDRRDFPGDNGHRRSWDWRLAYVGRVEDRKGVHVAVEALAHLPREATLEIDGSRDERYAQRLRERAIEIGVGDRITFRESRRSQLAEVYKRANVIVFPVVWPEPFGLVPIEAMACGTPVVATATGGSAEYLIDRVNCVVTPPGDARALADGIEMLAEDTAFRERVIAAGRLTAQRLDADTLAETLECWHLAAVNRFAEGEPADRPTLATTLAHLTTR